MSTNKISVIIPTFNRAHQLPRAVQSVLDQNTELWELIIIDDGSSDETRQVLQPFLKETKVRYYYQDNKGVSAARNKGAQLAGGDYLIFLDSDDFVNSNLIKSLIEAEYYNYDIICWQVLKVIDGMKSLWKPVKLGKIYHCITASFLAGSICYKKQIFVTAGGYDEKMSFGENYELGMRVSDVEDLRLKIINKPLMVNIVSTFNRTSNSLENRLDSYFHMYEKHKKKYKKDNKSRSEINYLLGYVLEKSNKPAAALKFYKKSWMTSPWKPKPFLKILYISLIS